MTDDHLYRRGVGVMLLDGVGLERGGGGAHPSPAKSSRHEFTKMGDDSARKSE